MLDLADFEIVYYCDRDILNNGTFQSFTFFLLLRNEATLIDIERKSSTMFKNK